MAETDEEDEMAEERYTVNASAFFLVGPTAVGKSVVAHAIAADAGHDIVSADSMAVYRGMDIGTAKPTAPQQAEVKYWCIDLVPVSATFNVAAYRHAAIAAVTEAASAGRDAIVVGGTGLYIKSLTHGLAALPADDKRVRSELEALLKQQGVESLAAVLERESPAMYRSMADKRNPRRLIRAVELARTGLDSVPQSWDRRGPEVIGLIMPRNQLLERIRQRAGKMFEGGLVQEVEQLIAAGLHPDSSAGRAIGYAEARELLEGRCSREDAILRTAERTGRLARRQLTWFKHQLRVKWINVDIAMDPATIARVVRTAWREHGRTPIST